MVGVHAVVNAAVVADLRHPGVGLGQDGNGSVSCHGTDHCLHLVWPDGAVDADGVGPQGLQDLGCVGSAAAKERLTVGGKGGKLK